MATYRLKVANPDGVEFKYHKSLARPATTITLPVDTQFSARWDATDKVYIVDDFSFKYGEEDVEIKGLKSLDKGLVGANKDYQFVNPADEIAAALANMAIGGRSRRHKRQRRTRKGKRRSNGRKTR